MVISEGIFGQKPRTTSFPKRNRIICGIALGCFVVQAKIKSGSLISARCAIEANREVFAMPGLPYDPNSGGCNYLIKNGAKLVENANDIIEEFDDNLLNIKVEHQVIENNKREQILAKITYDGILREDLINQLKIPINQFNIINNVFSSV